MMPRVVLVGGYLGAGKTTLLLKAAALLRARRLRVAIITNDQGGGLVDTRLAAAAGFEAEEIAGGCFCCRFSEFTTAAGRLLAFSPDVILAEPVGSCMDLAATVIQPLKRYYGDRFQVAPLTVLVDPDRAVAGELRYLYENQAAEADLAWFSKADLHPELPADRRLSALTGEGVEAWLETVLDEAAPAGTRQVAIDYGRYAEAEAALGWLNWHARLRLAEPLMPAQVAGPLLERLDSSLTAAGAEIAHLKMFVEAPTGWIRASVCRNGAEPAVAGDRTASPSLSHELVLNLRARAAPELLREIVEAAARELAGELEVVRFEAFRPAAPVRR